MRLQFHPVAELELVEAADHYERQVPGLGLQFEAEIRRATDLLLARPQIGPSVDPQLRKFILSRFPFTLYYGLTGDACALRPLRTSTAAPAIGRRGPTVERRG